MNANPVEQFRNAIRSAGLISPDMSAAPNEHARLAPGAGTTAIRKHRKLTAIARPAQPAPDPLIGWFNLAKSSRVNRTVKRSWRKGPR